MAIDFFLDDKPMFLEAGRVINVPQATTIVLPDVEVARKNLAVYDEKITEMVEVASEIEITSDLSLKTAVDLGLKAKTLAKEINKVRDGFIAEPNNRIKSVKNLAKSFTDRLDEIEMITKKKASDFNYKKILEQREKEKKAQDAARDLQIKLDEEAKSKGVEGVQVITPTEKPPDNTVRTEAGSSYNVPKMVCEIIDSTIVPREYCEPVMKRLNEAVKMGVREIPGCKIYETVETRYRT